MAIRRRVNSKLKSEDNSGFSSNASNTGGRYVNRDGKTNVVKRGVGFLERFSWYHTLIEMPSGRFLLLLFCCYIGINLIFAAIYYLIGANHLTGIIASTPTEKFTELFFFSTQTFTTVGYGRISPVGFLASAVATLEAFLGLLNFAIATGLFYGRFSKPTAFIRFSDMAVIAPYEDGSGLMLRLSPYKNNSLSDVEAKLTMIITTEDNGKVVDNFYTLDIEISKINSLALSWTIVHPINEKSPLFGFTEDDIKNTDIELLVFLKAFDDVFSDTVIAKTSYISKEIIWGAKFKLMYHPSEDKNKTVLDLDKLNQYDRVSVPPPTAKPLQNEQLD